MNLNLKMLKPKKKFKKGGIHINPDVYWGISIGVIFLVAISMMIFGYFLFKKTSAELTSTADTSANADAISKERIDKALEYFSKRAENSNTILNSPSPIVDPSR